MTMHCGEQIEGGEAAAADDDQFAVGEPAFGLQDRLPRPSRQRLVSFAVSFAPSRGRRENG
jgi:hypothetical protein